MRARVKECATVWTIRATPEMHLRMSGPLAPLILTSVGDRQLEIDSFSRALRAHVERHQGSLSGRSPVLPALRGRARSAGLRPVPERVEAWHTTCAMNLQPQRQILKKGLDTISPADRIPLEASPRRPLVSATLPENERFARSATPSTSPRAPSR